MRKGTVCGAHLYCINKHSLCRLKLPDMEQEVRCSRCVLCKDERSDLVRLAVVNVGLQLLHAGLEQFVLGDL